MTSKKIILLIFATMVTIALAVIAVVTSMKLREVATVPVAPNVPVSQPKAADGSYACQVSFTVTAPVTPTLTCTGLTASNTAPALNDTVTYTCAAAVTGMTGVTPTYEFRYKKPGDADFTAATSTGSTWSLLLDENGSYSVQCRATASLCANNPGESCTPTLTEWGAAACSKSVTISTTTTPKIACQEGTCASDSDCSAGLSCKSGKCVNPSCESDADCVCPEDKPKCNIECNPNVSDTGCSDGYVCEPNSRRCRNKSCTDREDCTCKVDSCNQVCNPNVSDTGCTDGLVCEPNSRRCRKSACTSESSCTCPTTSPTPIPTTIPKAGNPLPGLMFVFVGGTLVILGMLVAAAL